MENTCGFVHLHNHTMYSLLDGAIRPKNLIEAAKNWGMGAVAATDHGNMFNSVAFYLNAKSAGIRPIIGSEVYVAIEGIGSRTAVRGNIDGANHLVLLAETTQGYRNLMKIVSKGFLEGFYYHPRVDKEILREHSEGIIALSACLKGEVTQLVNMGRPEEAEKVALEYREIFGDGSYFLEIQDHGIPDEQKAIPLIAQIAKNTGIPLVATNDAHYLKAEHAESHEILLCISTGKTLDDPSRMKMETRELYFKSPDEMKELFKEYPEAIENTVKIAERCNVEIKTGEYQSVRYDIPAEFDGNADDYLRKIAEEGLVWRYGDDAPKHKERLHYELDIIKQMGFSDYFLAIYDCTKAAREMNVPVGTARGSAGGSIVAYTVGITNLDPIPYGLIFERFLNPERISMPDFDVDYADRYRGKMIDYVKEKYGTDHVCQIITFGTMKARLAVRDVGRVLNMPYPDVDAIAKLIPSDLGITLEKALDIVPELSDLQKKDNLHAALFKHALVLEGLNRHAATHAAGVVITPAPSTEFFPVYKPPGEDITSQYTMEYIEKIGCLKVDFLGLRTLTVIKDAVDMIHARGITVDIDRLPMDDPEVYDLMGRAETIGIFQFESPGMRDYLRKLRPSLIEDLIAMNALYRPGPLGSNMVDDFIERKHGIKEIKYPHPILEPILKETYGVIVYQEQVMKIANVMAGFSLGAADELRRAMGKKKVEVMAKMKSRFIDGAREKEISEKTSGDVFDLMAHFAGYGFNKSHSAGYAILAYQTAWLKTHHPAEFMAANLTSEMDNTDRVVVVIEECRRMGLDVLPPDINRSRAEFTVDDGNVRFGLGAIKNVGVGAIESMILAREDGGSFADVFDFCARVDLKALNKRMLESLIMSGAMDSFGYERALLFAGIEQAVEFAQAQQRERDLGQINLFAGPGESSIPNPTFPDVPPWSRIDRLANEKSVLGFWFSGHPLEGYQDEMHAFATPFKHLFTRTDRSRVTVGGVITTVTRKTTRKDKPMIILRIEDNKGSGEAILMNGAYEEFKDSVAVDQLVLIDGTVSNRNNDEQPSIFVNTIEALETARQEKTRAVTIAVSTLGLKQSDLDTITTVCEKHPGAVHLWLKLNTASAGTYKIKCRKYRVNPTQALLNDLRKNLGMDNVWIN